MLHAKTISTFVGRGWREVYDAFWQPENFPKWASGLSKSGLLKEGGSWKAQGAEGPITITFTDYNAFGVMDHWVDLGHGGQVYVPLRVVANGSGAEVLLTLFRQPHMSDEQFEQDVEWVTRDLASLKALAEGLPLVRANREQ